jgi:hypothetical protein
MIKVRILFLVLNLVPLIYGGQKSDCADAPPLSDDRIKEIIASERAKYKDMPHSPYSQYKTEIRRDGCYYLYGEIPLQEFVAPDSSYSIKLNKDGAIVDILSRNMNEGVGMKMADGTRIPNILPSWCSEEKVLSEKELAEIVAKARAKRSDLPQPFPKQWAEVIRRGCVYWYWEWDAQSKIIRRNNLFKIDRFGELMEP